MLTPRPDVLSELISRYQALGATQGDPGTARAREDAAYTLCVLTGTRDVGAALAKARRLLATTAPAAGRGGSQAPFVVVNTRAAAPEGDAEGTVVTV